jgi:hypothetical protein
MGGCHDITCSLCSLAAPGGCWRLLLVSASILLLWLRLGGVGPGLAATFCALILVNFVFGHFDLADSGNLAQRAIWVTASVGPAGRRRA